MLNEELKSLDSFPCVLVHDLWVFKPSFPKLPQHLNDWGTGITQHTEVVDTRVKFHLIWNKKLKSLLWIAFHVFLHVTWSIQAQFPKIKIWLYLKYAVENFISIFVCSCFYVVIKVILFSFRICMIIGQDFYQM